jgi:hypothetical protein
MSAGEKKIPKRQKTPEDLPSLQMSVRKLGLLTLGSSYWPRLPIRLQADSGLLRLSSPITAAGPYQNLTGFPFIALWG